MLPSSDAHSTALWQADPMLQANVVGVIRPSVQLAAVHAAAWPADASVTAAPAKEGHLTPQNLLLRQLPPPVAACGSASPCWPGQRLPQPWLQLRLQLWGTHPQTPHRVPGGRQQLICSAVGPLLGDRRSPSSHYTCANDMPPTPTGRKAEPLTAFLVARSVMPQLRLAITDQLWHRDLHKYCFGGVARAHYAYNHPCRAVHEGQRQQHRSPPCVWASLLRCAPPPHAPADQSPAWWRSPTAALMPGPASPQEPVHGTQARCCRPSCLQAGRHPLHPQLQGLWQRVQAQW